MIGITTDVWPWLQDLASIAPLATFAAAVVAVFALWQKSRNDRRQAWWERLRWATDTLLSSDPQSRQTGSAALKAVSKYKLRTAEDKTLLQSIANNLLDEEINGLEVIQPPPTEPDMDGGPVSRDDGTNEGGRNDGTAGP